jgi:type IV secretory pathway TrbL component
METKETKATPAAEKTVTGHTPLVHDVHTHEVKKVRKYSRGTRSAQELGRGMNRAAADLASAVATALETYRDRSNNSSYKKRDGMLRDAVENWAKAASEGMKKASDAPYDLVKSVSRGKGGKQIRSSMKMFTPPMFR